MNSAVRVEASKRPLTSEEIELLAPDLERRGLSPALLEVLPPRGRGFRLLRAFDSSQRFLGATVLMSVRPFVSIKQMLGEGNHVGWDVPFFLVPGVDRGLVTAAMLQAAAAHSMYYGIYFGRMDDDVAAALPHLRHRLLETDYRLGHIDTSHLSGPGDFGAGHKRLRRHLRDHERAGGQITVVEGPLDEARVAAFARCILSTYRHHGGWGRWLFGNYARRACPEFLRRCRDAVHVYSTVDGEIHGCQSYVRHHRRLELSEGGFLRDRDNHHAYEAIIDASVAYAAAHGLDSVGYGGIWNPAKDRYCEPQPRPPVHMLAVYRWGWQYRLFSDRVTAFAFRRAFGGLFSGGTGASRIVSRRSEPAGP